MGLRAKEEEEPVARVSSGCHLLSIISYYRVCGGGVEPRGQGTEQMDARLTSVPNTLLITARSVHGWVGSGQGGGLALQASLPTPQAQVQGQFFLGVRRGMPTQGIKMRAQMGVKQLGGQPASLVVLGEIFLAVIHIGFDGVASRPPAGGTDCKKLRHKVRGPTARTMRAKHTSPDLEDLAVLLAQNTAP